MAGGGELPFLKWLRDTDRPPGHVKVPVGDDGAVLEIGGDRIVVVADAIAEGAHFEPGTAPELVGRKALAVNLSDLAAMGAEPVAAVATAALPRGFDLARVQAMTRGMRELGERFGCPLVGGDTVAHGGGVVLSVTALGSVGERGAVTRAGARVGDVVLVTGTLGGSIKGRHLTFEPRIAEARKLVALGPPTGMIDVSDGLFLDLARVCDASGGLGFRLDADRIPVSAEAADLADACTGGEDFELLATADPAVAAGILAGWDLPTAITAIGEITAAGFVMVRDGIEQEVEARGFSHE